MSSRTFDPEETRRVGTDVVPALAEDYAVVAGLVGVAGRERDGISPELKPTFDAYHQLLHNAIVESTYGFDRLGPTLVAIAEDDELTEDEIENAMVAAAAEIQDSVYAPAGYDEMDTGHDPEQLDAAPNPYDDALLDNEKAVREQPSSVDKPKEPRPTGSEEE